MGRVEAQWGELKPDGVPDRPSDLGYFYLLFIHSLSFFVLYAAPTTTSDEEIRLRLVSRPANVLVSEDWFSFRSPPRPNATKDTRQSDASIRLAGRHDEGSQKIDGDRSLNDAYLDCI